MTPSYCRVDLWHHEWGLTDVVLADSPRTRLRGLNLRGVSALLLSTASIHTFTMSQPIHVSTIDGDGTVLATTLMKQRRIAVFHRGSWILEMDAAMAPPPPGIALRVLPSRDDARNTHDLWNTDREPERPFLSRGRDTLWR